MHLGFFFNNCQNLRAKRWKKANIHKRYVRNFTLHWQSSRWKASESIFRRRMWMVFGFGLNHISESSVRAKYTIYLPSFLAAIHYYVAFPLADILFITKDPLLVPQESRNVDVHPEGSVMDIHRVSCPNLYRHNFFRNSRHTLLVRL